MFYYIALPIFKRLDDAFAGSGNFHDTQLFRLHAEKYFFRHWGQFWLREELEQSLWFIWFYDFSLRAFLQQKENLIAERNLLLRCKKKRQRDIDILTESIRKMSLQFLQFTNHHSYRIVMLPDGPIKTSYLSLRRKPTWYLNKVLTQECVRKNGCCSRGCGCCERRSQQHKEEGLGIGHCTPECGCCKKAHGVFFRNEQERMSFWKIWTKPLADEPFRHNIHWHKVRQAFFFGVGG